MKTIIFILFSFIAISSKAQDTLYLYNKSKIICYVKKYDSEKIQYLLDKKDKESQTITTKRVHSIHFEKGYTHTFSVSQASSKTTYTNKEQIDYNKLSKSELYNLGVQDAKKQKKGGLNAALIFLGAVGLSTIILFTTFIPIPLWLCVFIIPIFPVPYKRRMLKKNKAYMKGFRKTRLKRSLRYYALLFGVYTLLMITLPYILFLLIF